MRVHARVAGNGMNRTEAAYALQLEARKRAGELQWYQYEAMRFVLAKATQYTPDFVVLTDAGAVEAHEIKGFWRDDARAKLKVAARLFPWVRFLAIRKSGAGWQVEEMGP
jgi:hypothetical protein